MTKSYKKTEKKSTVDQQIDFMSICEIFDSFENSLTIDKILFEVTGDLASTAVLSRLRYWFSPSKKNGQQRTRIYKDGMNWMARTDEEWFDEACVTVKEMKRIKKHLTELKLVDIRIFKFDGNPTTHWSLNIQKFTELYNLALQKKISKSTFGTKGKVPLGQKESDQKDISINKHINQASYTSSLDKHIGSLESAPPQEQNAFFKIDEKDAFYKPVLKGIAKQTYDSLNFEQKQAFTLIMNVPPIDDSDQRFNAVTALNIAKSKSLEEINKSILLYKQKIARGYKPRKMAPYLLTIISKGLEPEPEHAEENKNYWKIVQKHFPFGTYEQSHTYISFPIVHKEVSFSMTTEIFIDQLERIEAQLKNRN